MANEFVTLCKKKRLPISYNEEKEEEEKEEGEKEEEQEQEEESFTEGIVSGNNYYFVFNICF